VVLIVNRLNIEWSKYGGFTVIYWRKILILVHCKGYIYETIMFSLFTYMYQNVLYIA